MTLTQSSFALAAGAYLQHLQSCFTAEVLAAVDPLSRQMPRALL